METTCGLCGKGFTPGFFSFDLEIDPGRNDPICAKCNRVYAQRADQMEDERSRRLAQITAKHLAERQRQVREILDQCNPQSAMFRQQLRAELHQESAS